MEAIFREPLHRSLVLFGGYSYRQQLIAREIIRIRKMRYLRRKQKNPSTPREPDQWFRPFKGLYSIGDDPHVEDPKLRGIDMKLPLRFQVVDPTIERSEYSRRKLREFVWRHFVCCGYIDHPVAVALAHEVIDYLEARAVYVPQGLQLVLDHEFELECPDEHRPELDRLHERVHGLLLDPWIDWIYVPKDLATAAVQSARIVNACLADRSARSLSQPTGYPIKEE